MSYWQNTKVLVTGGCGFIGSKLVRRLVEHGAQVRVADNLYRGPWQRRRIADLGDAVEFREVDLTNRRAAEQAAEAMEVVFHLAANASGIGYSVDHQGLMLNQNILLNTNVLWAALQNGARRVINFSSSCVYPDGAPLPTSEDQYHQGWPERGNRGYGWAKRIGEIQAGFYREQYQLNITSIRPVNVAGEGDYYDEAFSHVIPALIRKAVEADDTLTVMGSGRQTRSFIDVNDLAEIVMVVAERGQDVEAINVSSPREIQISEIAEMVVKAVGRDDLRIAYDLGAPEGIARKCVDIKRLLGLLGAYPFTPLETTIVRMVQDYRCR